MDGTLKLRFQISLAYCGRGFSSAAQHQKMAELLTERLKDQCVRLIRSSCVATIK